MLATLILASALTAQVHANDGPPRAWHQAVVNGRTVQLWGWKNADGSIGCYHTENPQVWKPATPKPAAKPAPVTLGAGMVLEANGTINNGLDLKATQAEAAPATNDPEFMAKFGLDENRCPNNEPDDVPVDEPAATQEIPWVWLAIGLLFAYLLLWKD